MNLGKLETSKASLLVVDVQEKLFPHLDHECEFLNGLLKLVRGSQILGIPILATEQYPQGLGPTVAPLKNLLGESMIYWAKTSFSCGQDPEIGKLLKAMPSSQVIIAGIEAHICILQTARDLIQMGKQVVVVNDAITSRSIYDFSTAIAEMRDMGTRITTVETVLFELLGDAKATTFKAISQLVQT